MIARDLLSLGSAPEVNATALVEGGQSWTYGQLAELVAGCAGIFAAEGVGSQDLVAVYGNSSARAVLSMLAAWHLGAVYVGLNPKHTSRELGAVLADAMPRLVVDLVGSAESTPTALVTAMEGSGARRLCLTEADWQDRCSRTEPATHARTAPTDTAAVLYTSGSTGEPKGVMLSHRALRGGVEVMKSLVVPPVRCLSDYPINHVSWVIETTLLTLTSGGTLHLRPRFNAAVTLELIERHQLTVWQGAPSMFALCMSESNFETRDLSSVTSVLYFGGPMTVSALQRLHEGTRGARIATGWGMTETAGGVTLSRADDSLEMIAGTVGAPHPSTEVVLVNEDGARVAPGETGEILVRSPHLFDGYRNRPDATAEVLGDDGFLHTGDLAMALEDGSLRLVGRRRDMFKSGGYNVHPGEVERVLRRHPHVVDAVVVAVPDPLWNEVGIAFVQTGPGVTPPDLEALRKHCAQSLANYKIPKRVVHVDVLPVTPTGKVDRAALRALIAPAEEGATTS